MNDIIGIGYLISGCNGIGVYAGATTRPELRQKEHEAALRNQRHWNVDFQQAANEFGLAKFTFVNFPPVADLKELPKAEQQLFETVKAAGEMLFNKQLKAGPHPVGYKLSEKTRRKQAVAKTKTYTFQSPDGRIVTVQGLAGLCKKYGLTMSQMSRVSTGKSRSHKKWTRAEGQKEN